MAADLAKLAPYIADPAFRQRVALAFLIVAREVRDEPDTTRGHDARRNHANAVLMRDTATHEQYAGLVLSHPTVIELDPSNASSIPDDTLLQAIRDSWNALANVADADSP